METYPCLACGGLKFVADPDTGEVILHELKDGGYVCEGCVIIHRLVYSPLLKTAKKEKKHHAK